MTQYRRTFSCLRCRKEAELEPLHGVAVLISCQPCEISEVWDSEDMEPELLLFDYQDQRMAEA